MKISRTVGYALQATLQLANADPKVPVPCSRLASEGGLPERFLLQILRMLVNKGILESTRGVEGGYSLERNLDAISLLDLIEAVDGPLRAQLPDLDGFDPKAARLLEMMLDDVVNGLRRRLEQIKISSLAHGGAASKLDSIATRIDGAAAGR